MSLHHAGHLLRLRDGNGKPLSRERLIEEFSIFFVAGSETKLATLWHGPCKPLPT